MLWRTSALNGYVIEACESWRGTVCDLQFGDATWILR